MSNSSRKEKLRSFILDVPTRSHLSTPLEEIGDSLSKNFLLTQPISKFEASKITSRSSSMQADEAEMKVEPGKLKFYMKFLPFINAQQGPGKVKNILAATKSFQGNESLPITRKKHEVDILEDVNEKEPVFSRNKSLEVSKFL